MMRFAGRFYQDGKWWLAEVPALGLGAVTQGENLEEAREMAEDMVSQLLEGMVWDNGQGVPEAEARLPRGEGWEWVYPDTKTTMAIQIRELRQEAGLSMEEAAERIGVAKGTYQRWEHPQKCNARVETLDKIAAAFGRRFAGSFV